MARLLAVVASLAFVACGGDDDGGSTTDAPPGDGPPGTVDAAVDADTGNSLGLPCTGTGQGTCPAGHECMTLFGGSGSWCSKRCADFQDPSCADFYTGVGYPICVPGIRPNPGAEPAPYCQIVCEDLEGPPMICLPGECTGACPSPLVCTQDLRDAQGQTLARACQ